MTVLRRRVLLTCFCCSPLQGSEPGVGWHWLLEIVKRHDVVLVTHTYYKQRLETAFAANPIDGLLVHYLGPTALGIPPEVQLNSRLFYVWWQWCLKGRVRKLLSGQSFDLIHHLTWGTFRFPCFLGGLGVPLVMGPLGGGEVAPWSLFYRLPLRDWIFELIRVISMRSSLLKHLSAMGLKASTLVLCKTEETLLALPAIVHPRSVVAPEIGAPEVNRSGHGMRPFKQGPFRLLFAGQLRGLKGVAHAVGALHFAVEAGYDVTLDIAGDGPLRGHLEREIKRYGLTARVRLLGMIPREQLFLLYGHVDAFLFPSLHDSSGNVVLESLSRGLPVVCLDLGGPKNYLTPACGVVISTRGRTRTQVEQALAKAVTELIDTPERLQAMSKAAFTQAERQTWKANVDRAYGVIEQRLNWTAADPMQSSVQQDVVAQDEPSRCLSSPSALRP